MPNDLIQQGPDPDTTAENQQQQQQQHTLIDGNLPSQGANPPNPVNLDVESHVDTSLVHFRRLDVRQKVPVILSSEIKTEQFQFIGSGAFGTVYRGMWQDQDVALKVLNVPTDQVNREASHLCRLTHPNVVRFFGLCESGPHDAPTLVMEFAHGGSLNRIIAARPVLAPSTLFRWALQIATGMAYLHVDARLVHRDLKSCNILIREPLTKPYVDANLRDSTLLITDFGMACRSSELVSQHSKLGTVAYAAPEVCRQACFSFKSDVWSFGVVLWELLMMEAPFRNMEQPRLLYLIAMYNYTSHVPATVPELFAKLLSDCWSALPDSRPDFPEIIARLECSTYCDFLNMDPEEFAQIQSDWREAVLVYRQEEQEEAALTLSSSSMTASSLRATMDMASDLTTEKQLLQSGWECLDQYWHELTAREYEIASKEEQYTRLAGKIGHQFTLLAVLAANCFKDANPLDLRPSPTATATNKPVKPVPARKRPFTRMWFRRTGTSNSVDSLPDCGSNGGTTTTTATTAQATPHKRHRSKVKHTRRSTRSPGPADHRTTPSSMFSIDRLADALPGDSASSTLGSGSRINTKRRLGRHTSLTAAGGGMPHISPPLNMKHMVHVDPQWITGHRLSTVTLNLFPFHTDHNDPCSSRWVEQLSDHVYANLLVPTADLGGDTSMVKPPAVFTEDQKALSFPSPGSPIPSGPRPALPQQQQQQQQSFRPFHRPFVPALSTGDSTELDRTRPNPLDCVGLTVPRKWSTPSYCGQSSCDLGDQSPGPVRVSRPIGSQGDASLELATRFGRDHDRLGSNSLSVVCGGAGGTFDRRRSASGPILSTPDDAHSPRPDLVVSQITDTEFVRLLSNTSPLLVVGSSTKSSSSSSALAPEFTLQRERSRTSDSTQDTRPGVELALWSVLRLTLSLCFGNTVAPSKANSPDPAQSLPTPECTGQPGKKRIAAIRPDRILDHVPVHNGRPRRWDFTPRYLHLQPSRPAFVVSARPSPPADGDDDYGRIRSIDRFFRGNPRAHVLPHNIDLVARDPSPSSLVAHHAEFGDPHSPFLGMLAGSGRRPNVPHTRTESCTQFPAPPDSRSIVANRSYSSCDRVPTGWTDVSRCTPPATTHLLAPPPQSPMPPDLGSRSRKLGGQLSFDALSVRRELSDSPTPCDGHVRTDPRHSPSQLGKWDEFEGTQRLRPHVIDSPREQSARREELVLHHRHCIRVDRCARLGPAHIGGGEAGSVASLSDTSYNPVAHSRDAYLKATQDGYLNHSTPMCGDPSLPDSSRPTTSGCSELWMAYTDSDSPDDLTRPNGDGDYEGDGPIGLDVSGYSSDPEEEEELGSTSVIGFPGCLRAERQRDVIDEDEDSQTLVPHDLDAQSQYRFASDEVNGWSSGRSLPTLPRRPLQRSPAIRSSQKPDFLFLDRVRSASAFSGSSPTVYTSVQTSRDAVRSSSPHENHHNHLRSPCGPFVSAHSTFL